jgi:aminoglycoside phosphotransferase (APT) family kinase protein
MEETRTEAAVLAAFLQYLRARFAAPALDYRAPPRRLTGGFDAAIFAVDLTEAPTPLSRPLVLRLFAPTDNPDRARREGAVQSALTDLGYPAPRALLVETDRTVLGGAFILMEWLVGRVLSEGAEGPRKRSGGGALIRTLVELPRAKQRMLALWSEAQRKLHALPVDEFERRIAASGLDAQSFRFAAHFEALAARIEQLRLGALEPGLAWLRSHEPRQTRPAVLCHGDLHPVNILAENGTLTGVVDWSQLAIADPALDFGTARAILATVPLPGPPLLRALRRAAINDLARRYVRAGGCNEDATLRYYQVFNALMQLSVVGLRARREPIARGYRTSAGVRNLIAHIRKFSGVVIEPTLLLNAEADGGASVETA